MAIAQLQMADANKRLSSTREISFVANKSLLQELATQSVQDAHQGARSIRRLIQQMVENPLSDNILNGDIVDGDRLTLSWRQPEGLRITKRAKSSSKK
jgi:ATP-dependent Clp protease ATP-binding subunit ClpA